MKKKISVILIVIAILTITMGAYQIHRITERPESYFEEEKRVSAEVTPAPTPLFDLSPYLSKQQAKATPIQMYIPGPAVPTADPDPLGDGKPLSGIVNIALFGIDALENGGTTSGTMPHTDANMIVAVNFDTKEVSLISIARDIFTDVPGHDGFYKFNCIFNVGGGMEDPKAGLELTCRGAEEWLGGISVPYYFGLDFKAAMDVVDAIGGLDYDVERFIPGYGFTPTLSAGKQHLDGPSVFSYLRARKGAGNLDYLRTERQRKMMIALFRKIKEAGQLSLIPNILEAMGKDLYTNMTIPQVAALVAFAADVDPDQIRSYSIHGDMYEQYFWRYSMIDQQKRIDILKEVYGIDAAPMPVDTVVYEKFLYDSGFMALQHLGYAKRLFAHIHSSVSEGEMTEAQKQAYAQCWKDYEDLRAMYDQVDQWTRARYDKLRLPVEDQNQRLEYYRALGQLERELRTTGDALNKAFGSPLELKWTTGVNNWYLKDSVINEVYVDFA